MCIFNTKIVEVGGTKILVARCGNGKRQLVVYRNYVSAEFDTKKVGRSDPSKLKAAEDRLQAGGATPAMILPFPCSDPTHPVQLVDLHTNKTLFTDLQHCFPTAEMVASQELSSSSRARSKLSSSLPVHKVGSYNVSIAYSLNDLRRIDASVFTVAPNVDTLLAKYYGQGYGFIIAAFADNAEKHPLAYIHDAVEGSLFVPTRHYHHGEKEEDVADWDHEIYSIGATPEAGESPSDAEKRITATLKPGWQLKRAQKSVVDVLKSLPVVPDVPNGHELRLLSKHGKIANGDVVLPVV